MKKNPFEMIADNKSPVEVLRALTLVPEVELRSLAEILNDLDLARIINWTSHRVNSFGVQLQLATGGSLYMFRTATDKEGRRELFPELIENWGLTTTKAYDCIAVFRNFGRPLLEQPALQEYFRIESLKKLSRVNATAEAREEALSLARKGELVTIKIAESLVAKHLPVSLAVVDEVDDKVFMDDDLEVADEIEAGTEFDTKLEFDTKVDVSDDVNDSDSITTSAEAKSPPIKSKPAKPVSGQQWTYQGSVVRLSIELIDPAMSVADEMVLVDLETAIDEYRRHTLTSDAQLSEAS